MSRMHTMRGWLLLGLFLFVYTIGESAEDYTPSCGTGCYWSGQDGQCLSLDDGTPCGGSPWPCDIAGGGGVGDGYYYCAAQDTCVHISTWSADGCGACPEGYVTDGEGQCVPNPCDPGYHYDAATDSCVPDEDEHGCVAGEFWCEALQMCMVDGDEHLCVAPTPTPDPDDCDCPPGEACINNQCEPIPEPDECLECQIDSGGFDEIVLQFERGNCAISAQDIGSPPWGTGTVKCMDNQFYASSYALTGCVYIKVGGLPGLDTDGICGEFGICNFGWPEGCLHPDNIFILPQWYYKREPVEFADGMVTEWREEWTNTGTVPGEDTPSQGDYRVIGRFTLWGKMCSTPVENPKGTLENIVKCAMESAVGQETIRDGVCQCITPDPCDELQQCSDGSQISVCDTCPPDPPDECPPGEARCDDGTCIAEDSTGQCPDGSCPPGFAKCADGWCLPIQELDAGGTCIGGSCPIGTYWCEELNACIPNNADCAGDPPPPPDPCDGIKLCWDGSIVGKCSTCPSEGPGDQDTDGDGVPDEEDSDDDGDGVPDNQDRTPRIPNPRPPNNPYDPTNGAAPWPYDPTNGAVTDPDRGSYDPTNGTIGDPRNPDLEVQPPDCIYRPSDINPATGLPFEAWVVGWCNPVTHTCWVPLTLGEDIRVSDGLIFIGNELADPAQLEWIDSQIPCEFQELPDTPEMVLNSEEMGLTDSQWAGAFFDSKAAWEESQTYALIQSLKPEDQGSAPSVRITLGGAYFDFNQHIPKLPESVRILFTALLIFPMFGSFLWLVIKRVMAGFESKG